MMYRSYDFRRYSGKVYLPLYKYFGNYQYAEDTIINRRIHLEKPEDYNDIYDSAFVMDPASLKSCVNTTVNMCNILSQLLPDKYQSALEECKKTENNNYFSIHDFITFACSFNHNFDEQQLVRDCIQCISGGGLLRAYNNRISCFTERNDSLLMWAYYAANHTGVCLGFDLQSDSNMSQFCSKVNYSHLFCGNARTHDNYFIKSDEWSHEQEWRIVCYTDNEYLHTNSLRSIILGARTPEYKRKDFLRLGKEHGLNVYQVKPSITEFKLDIVSLN